MIKKLENLLKGEIDPAFARRARFILTSIEKDNPKSVLDIGCGRGFYLNAVSYFSSIKTIEGIDTNKEYLGKARLNVVDKRVSLNYASAYALPYPKNSFDCVILSEVLEHLSDEVKALSEVKRVLKKNGTLLISVPNKNFPFLWDPLNWLLSRVLNTHVNKDIWWLAGMWADHLRLYDEANLKKLLKENGFITVKSGNYINKCWPFSHFLLYGIGKNIIERLNIKKFSRFKENKSPAVSFLATLFAYPSRFEKEMNGEPYVSLAIKAISS